MFDKLFKLYQPYGSSVNHDNSVLIPNLIGGGLTAISFIGLGIICLIVHKKKFIQLMNPHVCVIAQLVGFFLLTCGFSRAMDIISLWCNYALINGYLKVITGIISFITLLRTPGFIKKLKDVDLSDIKKDMAATSEKIDKLQEVTNRLNEGVS